MTQSPRESEVAADLAGETGPGWVCWDRPQCGPCLVRPWCLWPRPLPSSRGAALRERWGSPGGLASAEQAPLGGGCAGQQSWTALLEAAVGGAL